MIEDMDLRQEKLDDMREDMLIEAKLRNDSDYFYDHMYDKFGEDLDSLRFKIENEAEFYGYDADEWFQFMTEK